MEIINKNKLMLSFFFLLPFLTFQVLKAQNIELKGKNIKLYLDVGKTDNSFDTNMRLNSIGRCFRIGYWDIDRNGDGIPNLDSVRSFVIKNFSNRNDSSICIIDWEGVALNQLKEYSKNRDKYPYQIGRYISVVEAIREVRPKLKIGIYNIPFRFWKPTSAFNYKYLYPLLMKCDLICPSPYSVYADTEVSSNRNKEYFEANIQVALKIAKSLGKEVLPFVGIRYYSSPSIFYRKLVPLDEFKKDIEYILNTSVDGKFVTGLILWNNDRGLYDRKNKDSFYPLLMGKNTFMEIHFSTIKSYASIIDSLRRNLGN